MTQYGNFFDAYMAKDRRTPAQKTWTPGNLQGLANAHSGLNPTWAPPPEMNAALPNPIQPVQFDPMGDVGYAATDSAVTNANTHAVAERDYQGHRGAQNFGYDSSGNLVTSGPDVNPYAQAAILKKHYDNSVRGTNNSYAAQNQLYGGALNNAQDTNTWNYGVGSDQLQRAAQDFYHGQDQNVQNVADSGLFQKAGALGPALRAFLEQRSKS